MLTISVELADALQPSACDKQRELNGSGPDPINAIDCGALDWTALIAESSIRVRST